MSSTLPHASHSAMSPRPRIVLGEKSANLRTAVMSPSGGGTFPLFKKELHRTTCSPALIQMGGIDHQEFGLGLFPEGLENEYAQGNMMSKSKRSVEEVEGIEEPASMKRMRVVDAFDGDDEATELVLLTPDAVDLMHGDDLTLTQQHQQTASYRAASPSSPVVFLTSDSTTTASTLTTPSTTREYRPEDLSSAQLLKLRLKVALYKVQTRQTSLPMSQLLAVEPDARVPILRIQERPFSCPSSAHILQQHQRGRPFAPAPSQPLSQQRQQQQQRPQEQRQQQQPRRPQYQHQRSYQPNTRPFPSSLLPAAEVHPMAPPPTHGHRKTMYAPLTHAYYPQLPSNDGGIAQRYAASMAMQQQYGGFTGNRRGD